MFESEEPHFYPGDLKDSAAVLAWVNQFVSSGAEEARETESSGDLELDI